MASVQIKVNLDEVKDSINGLKADMPWVLQNTINNLLKGAQQKQFETMRNNFTIRNETFLKYSVRLQFATRQSETGRIYIADIGGKNTSNIWTQFEGGGTKTPTRGKYVAVPTQNAWPNKSKPIPQRNKPRNLDKSFVVKKGTNTFIVARKGRYVKSNPNANTKVMFVLTPGVRIPDRLHFYSTIIPYINQNFNMIMNDALQYSMKKRGF